MDPPPRPPRHTLPSRRSAKRSSRWRRMPRRDEGKRRGWRPPRARGRRTRTRVSASKKPRRRRGNSRRRGSSRPPPSASYRWREGAAAIFEGARWTSPRGGPSRVRLAARTRRGTRATPSRPRRGAPPSPSAISSARSTSTRTTAEGEAASTARKETAATTGRPRATLPPRGGRGNSSTNNSSTNNSSTNNSSINSTSSTSSTIDNSRERFRL